ncbi:TetR/AcrR family transcriptional regulator [Nocardia sp. GCM10030253]|uniref:TetR/AcrR family transcriptional regulator n=1 Tax=Nocardia sp. GCM10030253 TaxID=3273404 RepID=UPI003634B9B2
MAAGKRAAAEPARRRYAKRLQPADRREQLLDAARKIVAESGFTDVSVAAVAERGGVTRPVVYDSFGSRDELLADLIERETSRMQEAVSRAMTGVDGSLESGAEPREVLSAALTRFLAEVQAMPETWRLVYFPISGVPSTSRERVEQAHDELRAPLHRVLGAWLAGRPDTDEVDLDVLVQLIQGLIQTSARLVLDEPDRFDVDRILAQFELLFFPES